MKLGVSLGGLKFRRWIKISSTSFRNAVAQSRKSLQRIFLFFTLADVGINIGFVLLNEIVANQVADAIRFSKKTSLFGNVGQLAETLKM